MWAKVPLNNRVDEARYASTWTSVQGRCARCGRHTGIQGLQLVAKGAGRERQDPTEEQAEGRVIEAIEGCAAAFPDLFVSHHRAAVLVPKCQDPVMFRLSAPSEVRNNASVQPVCSAAVQQRSEVFSFSL